MSENESPEAAETAPEPQPFKKFRMGSYVGDDLQITVHLLGLGQTAANLAAVHVDADGNANLNSLFVMDMPVRDAGKWEVRSDEDSSSAACVAYLGEFPAKQIAAFAKLASNLDVDVWGESNSIRYEHSYRRGKPFLVFDKPVRWWSSKTGYRDVPYAEFVRIHGEADE